MLCKMLVVIVSQYKHIKTLCRTPNTMSNPHQYSTNLKGKTGLLKGESGP